MAANQSVAAVIPAFNECIAIQAVVHAVSPFACPIVVDDGSGDRTAELAAAAGADVVSQPRNLGYDKALERGLFRAIELGFEYAVTIDGDGQHFPEMIGNFVNELVKGADLVIGIRDSHQRVAESLFAAVAWKLWHVHDPLCGMKGYRLALIRHAGFFDSYGSIGTEFTLRAARSGSKIVQLPMSTRVRTGPSRFGTGLYANWRILRALMLGLMRARRLQ